jgi:hypothetical protein
MLLNPIGIQDSSPQLRNILIIGSFVYLFVLAIIMQSSELQFIGMALAPLPLFLFRFNSYHVIIFYFACNLFFFPASDVGANFYFMQIGDAVLIAYFLCYFLTKKNFFTFVLPRNVMVLSLYVFIIYIMIRSVGPVMSKGYEVWLFYDIKKYLSLALVAFFCSQQIFGPKKITGILLCVIFFTILHGLVSITFFFFTHERQLTWNEIYFGNIPIVCFVLFNVVQELKYKIFLTVSTMICFIGMLATQTRSIWLSTGVCLAAYLLYQFIIKIKNIEIGQVIKTLFLVGLMVVIVQVLMQLFLGIDLGTYLIKRLTSFNTGDQANPFSSIGYRFYESYCVWLQHTFWGHGTGARLFLFETQGGTYKFINWWSIHSEYMEIIHKWGIFGLGLYFVFIAFFIKQSFQLMLSKKKFISAIGAVTFLTFVNTLVISLTSGYAMRANMIIYDVLLVSMVSYYINRTKHMAAIRRRTPAVDSECGAMDSLS